ncbi:TBPIP-domain-containing protein [Boletus reticuloceps]|uniref:TBPIP-domain-containing protein n=1 Tax=Boletus reticuloceps TaxID=495285 RepID=A0A8I2YWI1_9AGAM|nr:TBPIP-domain-containing protein [Boletus reticuloceps]
MTTKAKSDVKVLKGQDAEDAILQYMKKMNRPFGAVDISANLKGAVPKATTAKILVSLADKGAIIQKTYGKTNFYVANQNDIDTLDANELAALDMECKTVEEANNVVAAEVKSLQLELNKLKNTPTGAELEAQIEDANKTIARLSATLAPLRSGVPLISSDDLAQLDADWNRWRPEWCRRKKIFTSFWQFATDTLPPQDATALAEDLGIEFDTPEHTSLERGPLCAVQGQNSKPNLKRKRE